MNTNKTIKLSGKFHEPEEEREAVMVDMWYDHNTRNWVVQSLDNRRQQVGESDFPYSEGEAKADVETRRKEIQGDGPARYYIQSVINPALLLAENGEFISRSMMGPGTTVAAKVYLTSQNAGQAAQRRGGMVVLK